MVVCVPVGVGAWDCSVGFACCRISENAGHEKAVVNSKAPSQDAQTLILRSLSPIEEACQSGTRQPAESNSYASLGFGTLVWEFDYIRFLVALVDLNVDLTLIGMAGYELLGAG